MSVAFNSEQNYSLLGFGEMRTNFFDNIFAIFLKINRLEYDNQIKS